MKKIFLIACLLFITGCTNKYTLIISDDKIEEKINVVIPKDDIPTHAEEGIELDDEITPFIESDQHPFFNNDNIKYNKSVKEDSNKYVIDYKYTYKPEEFINSNVLHTCFENYGYSYDKEYYLKISGRFYCAYSEKTEINIKVKNRVLYSNADKKSGNTYTWYIDSKNSNSVNIELRIAKGFDLAYILPYAVSVTAIVLIFIFGLKFIKKRIVSNKI